MKNLIVIVLLFIFSCKQTQEKSIGQTLSNQTTLNTDWTGDSLISDLNFINSIDSSCKLTTLFFDQSEEQKKINDTKCALSKIKFDYSKLDSVKTQITVGHLDSKIKIYLKKSNPKNVHKADLFNQITLYTEVNKIITDSIIIYKSINYIDALTVKTRYYNINKNKIYLVDIAEDEDGASVEKWYEYKIDLNGNLGLLKQQLFPKNEISENTNIAEDISWKGVYHFEALNRDQIKTTFDVVINSLQDVDIKFDDNDGSKENYENVKAQQMNQNKIKLNFSPSAEDGMGIIFIEKLNNDYLISGNPIYYINPGNDHMPLKKIK